MVATRHAQAEWVKLFDEMTEVKLDQVTHYDARSCVQSKIDRVFETMPRCLIALLSHSASVCREGSHLLV